MNKILQAIKTPFTFPSHSVTARTAAGGKPVIIVNLSGSAIDFEYGNEHGRNHSSLVSRCYGRKSSRSSIW